MRYLGIDYGTKKIGIAVSDENGKIAFPHVLLKNDNEVLKSIKKIIEEKKVGAVVIGKSIMLSGEENPLQRNINIFIEKLSQFFAGKIFEEDERMSSLAARARFYGKGNIANEHWTKKENLKKREAIDPAAASIILQRFIDKNNPY